MCDIAFDFNVAHHHWYMLRICYEYALVFCRVCRHIEDIECFEFDDHVSYSMYEWVVVCVCGCRLALKGFPDFFFFIANKKAIARNVRVEMMNVSEQRGCSEALSFLISIL